MPAATIHLIARQAGTDTSTFIDQLRLESAGESPYIIKGKPCGWVHRPHSLDKDQLVSHDWDLFLLTEAEKLPDRVAASLTAHLSVTVDIPQEQYDTLMSRIDTPSEVAKDTPPLPDAWQTGNKGDRIDSDPSGQIPSNTIVEDKNGELDVGELRLDKSMATFLSGAGPDNLRASPMCYFNLFKYKNGDRTTHDHYMQGFKDQFGPAAGAQVKFMGPVQDRLKYDGEGSGSLEKWDDANLVQYDSVWHYAYMLSTDIYKELNKEKVSGLEDTCILLVSEMAV